MKSKLTKTLFVFSIVLNALFVIFLFSALGKKIASFAFYNIEKDGGLYTSAAAIVSVPRAGSIIFGPLEITLTKGSKAAVQFSIIADKNQMNIINDSLYDHGVISVEKTGYGIIIHARGAGETVMQFLSDDGIKDFARVIVRENE
jgi:hypothetical protein